MGYVTLIHGKKKRIRVDWLKEHARRVSRLATSKNEHGYVLITHLDNGAKSYHEFRDVDALWDFTHRPCFYGKQLSWFGMEHEIYRGQKRLCPGDNPFGSVDKSSLIT